MLVCDAVSKRFGDNVVLDRASLTVGTGQVLALTGPSGSGKTTLLRILSFLDRPDSGAVRLDDDVVWDDRSMVEDERVHPQVTMVFQQHFLWPHLKNHLNIALGLDGPEVGDAVEQLTRRLDIDGLLQRYPNEVSLGQRQRIALCRALVRAPRYLLLDEVTSALDRRLELIVAEVLLEASRSGMGLVVSTHEREFVDALNATALRLEAGVLAGEKP